MQPNQCELRMGLQRIRHPALTSQPGGQIQINKPRAPPLRRNPQCNRASEQPQGRQRHRRIPTKLKLFMMHAAQSDMLILLLTIRMRQGLTTHSMCQTQ